MANLYLSLGSNLGNRHMLMLMAIEALARKVGRLVRCSSFIETAPWGFESLNPFLNAVALFRTTLSPWQLLTVTQEIERSLGRKQKSDGTYADRPIDIDILLYDNEHINEAGLQIPHPLMSQRDFVMRPLAEIAPEVAYLIEKEFGNKNV